MNARHLTRKGIAATELAICLPLLFVLTMFSIQLAQGYHLRSIADQAAWRAVRFASTNHFREEEIEQWKSDVTAQAIEELSQLPQFNEENLTLNIDVNTIGERVEIDLTLDLVMETPLKLLPGDFEVHRNLRIRQYR